MSERTVISSQPVLCSIQYALLHRLHVRADNGAHKLQTRPHSKQSRVTAAWPGRSLRCCGCCCGKKTRRIERQPNFNAPKGKRRTRMARRRGEGGGGVRPVTVAVAGAVVVGFWWWWWSSHHCLDQKKMAHDKPTARIRAWSFFFLLSSFMSLPPFFPGGRETLVLFCFVFCFFVHPGRAGLRIPPDLADHTRLRQF